VAPQDLIGTFAAGFIDAPTAVVVAAIISVFSVAAGRLIPKTRAEAAVDRAEARVHDAAAWAQLLKESREGAAMWRAEAESLRKELGEALSELEEARSELAAARELVAQLRREVGELREQASSP
jgi:hypothetical protein